MSIGSILTLAAFSSTPSPPPSGFLEMYVQGTSLFLQDSAGNVYEFGSTTAIAQLIGDVSAIGPGTATATVNFVGGQSAANVASATTAYMAATSINTPNTLVLRDSSGNFSAGIITANLTGNATTATTAGSAINFTGSLSGDVTGTQSSTTVVAIQGTPVSNTAPIDTQILIYNSGTSRYFPETLSGDATMDHSGVITLSATAVTGKLLTGYVVGSNTPLTATNTILQGFENLQAQINSSMGSAITSLTGDVTATGPGAAVATIQKIQGTTVSGTTGTGNVVFSASPTLTGTLNGSAAIFSSTISASNFSGSSSGTNTGDVTTTNTNSIDLAFSSGQTGLSATLNLSASGPDSGYIPALSQIKTDGLLVEVLAGTPVQIGTSNNIGSAASAARSDHVHAITSPVILGLLLTGYVVGTNTPLTATNTILQGFENLQAQINSSTGSAITSLTGDVTATGPGAAAATVVAIQGKSVSSTSPTDAQLLVWVSGTSKWTPVSFSGDVLVIDTGVLTIQPNVVSNAKLAQAPTLTLKGNNAGGTANVTDLTVAQVNTMLGTVTTVGAYNGGTANANGASITPNSIFLQSASLSFPGMVDTTTQSFAGNKNFTGNVVVQSLEANGTGGNGFVQIDTQSATPTSPPVGDLKLYTTNSNGFNRTRELDSTGSSFALDRDLYEVVYNNSGATISKGQFIYINGVYTGGAPNVPTIALAQANSNTTAPAFGMCYDTITNNSFGRVLTNGNITGINTSGFTNGQAVYLSAAVAGGITATEPLAPNISQLVGYVTNAAASGNVDLSVRAGLNTASGTYRSSFQIGPNLGSSTVSLAFANAFIAMLQWNPTAAFALLLPPTLPAAGQYLGAADGVGTLQWTNPLVNIDGGSPTSNYVASQLINGGTP